MALLHLPSTSITLSLTPTLTLLLLLTLATASPLVLVRQRQTVCACLTTGLNCDSIACTEDGCLSTCCKDCADHPLDPLCSSAEVKSLCMPSNEEFGTGTKDGILPSPCPSPSPSPKPPSDTQTMQLVSPEAEISATAMPTEELAKAETEFEPETPSGSGRPFPLAACRCLIAGAECDEQVATDSGVCASGVEADKQQVNCLFTCCRLCTVNSAAVYCSEEVVKRVCQGWIR